MRTKIIIEKIVIEIEHDEEERAAHEPAPAVEPPIVGNGNGTHQLSSRELRILELLGEGCPNKVIAARLCLCESTVKVHLKAILRKLQVKNRTQAALLHQNGAAT